MEGAIVSFTAEDVTIRNCVFINSANSGVELSGAGSRFENNLLLNMIGVAMLDLRSSNQMIDRPIIAAGNSFCFVHDISEPAGKGGDRSLAIRVNCPASIEDNVFVACGNAAIGVILDPARISIDRNLFFAMPHDAIDSRAIGKSGEIAEKDLDEMEDLGFKSCAGNIVQDPAITGLQPTWLDPYSRDLFARYAKPPREAANIIRAAAGLPALAPSDVAQQNQAGGIAPRLAVPEALTVSFGAKQGFHAVELSVEIAPRTEEPARTYRKVDWSAIGTPDPSLAGARVELRAGLGAEQNSSLLADAGPDTHMGVHIYKPGSDDSPVFVLIRRSTVPARQYREAITYNRGVEVENTYYLRGIYRTDVSGSRQKATLVVESIAPAPVFAPDLPARPAGRDWFVRAGSSGGDGTREKPFRDPFQALEKAEGGDTIHVAGGDYFGKLRSGKWIVSIRNLALLGGYNTDFTNRDPWANPARFLLHEDEKAKGRPAGTILDSGENSDGLIVDGFIFDGATWNTYLPSGSLDIANSPVAPLVSLRGGRDRVTVRNCVFINGSSGAVILSCPFGIFENNIVLNNSGCSLEFRAVGPGPASIRNNTFLFASDPTSRAGTGKSNPDGSLVLLSGRAHVEIASNIFAFADNFGVRSTIPQQNVSFENNVFSANLFNHLTDDCYLWADSTTWERRAVADSSFATFTGNVLDLPGLQVDAGFADVALRRLFALPSRIAAEEWKALAAQIGSSAKPAAPAAPTAPPVEAPGSSSLDSLLAKLGSLTDKSKQQDSGKAAGKEGPVYCPVFNWEKALALAQQTSEIEPGAHSLKLAIAFNAPQTAPEIEYLRITSQEIDTTRESLDNKAVELDVTELRESSRNPSLFPAGTSDQNYAALSAAAVDGTTRSRIAIIVKLDTAASKLMQRISSRDKLKIRGTAHRKSDSTYLSIIVDNAEILEPDGRSSQRA